MQVVGVHAPQKHPSLVNLNDDPLMSEVSWLNPARSVHTQANPLSASSTS